MIQFNNYKPHHPVYIFQGNFHHRSRLDCGHFLMILKSKLP